MRQEDWNLAADFEIGGSKVLHWIGLGQQRKLVEYDPIYLLIEQCISTNVRLSEDEKLPRAHL